MGLFDFFSKKNTSVAKTLTIDDLGWEPLGHGIYVSENKAFKSFTQESTLYACIMILSQDVAKVPLIIYEAKENGDKVRAVKHPLYNLFSLGPNDYQTAFDFKEHLIDTLLKNGNYYAFVERNYKNEVTKLSPIQADSVSVYEDDEGNIWYGVSARSLKEKSILDKYEKYLANGRFMIPSRYIFHIKDRPNGNGVVGASRIQEQAAIVRLSLNQSEFQNSQIDNKAIPAVAIEHPAKLSSEAKSKLKDAWENKYMGASKAFKTVILDEGMKLNPVKVSSSDLELMSQAKLSSKNIAKIFRVPNSKLMDREGSTYNNNEAENSSFVNDGLMPLCEKIEGAINKFLSDDPKFFAEFDFSRLLRADAKTRAYLIQTKKQWGINSTNEIRQEEGYNRVDGGDKIQTPMNMEDINSKKPPKENENA